MNSRAIADPVQAQVEKLARIGVPAEHIATSGTEVHIVLSPEEVSRLSVVMAVLEATSAVRSLLSDVWAD